MKAEDYFGDYENGWDEDGNPGIMYVANAIQFWSIQQDHGTATIPRAAEVFQLSESIIREAVDHHPWMFIGANDSIEHDGE